MPLTVKALTDGTAATATFQWQGDTVTIRYRPSKLTAGLLDDLATEAEQGGEAGNVRALVRSLAVILEGWDVLEADGGPELPTDEATLRTLPVPFLVAVSGALRAEQEPSPTNGGSFTAGS